MSSVAKLLFGASFWLAAMAMAQSRPLTILVVGSGAAANCNEPVRLAPAPVHQFAADGAAVPARALLAEPACAEGSLWPLVGQQLARAGVATSTTFLVLAESGGKVVDWLPGGIHHFRIKAAVELARRQRTRFDYVLFQPGCADAVSDIEKQAMDLLALSKYLVRKANVRNSMVAQGAVCPRASRPLRYRGQDRIWRAPIYGRYLGPDTSALGPAYAYGSQGLNEAGQVQLATKWADAIASVEKSGSYYQRESLLHYFR
jgi:hypothetical protein